MMADLKIWALGAVQCTVLQTSCRLGMGGGGEGAYQGSYPVRERTTEGDLLAAG
jgi:hypothetical protein